MFSDWIKWFKGVLQLNDAFHKKEKDKWDLDKLHLFCLVLVVVTNNNTPGKEV